MTATAIVSITNPISCITTKEINGAWTAQITILPDDYISTESYVDIDGEEYIVKRITKIKSQGKHYYDVYLEHNMSELADVTIERFYYTKTVSNILTLILSDSGWSVGTCDISATVLLSTDKRVSVLEALNLLAAKCSGELYFNSKARTVDLKTEIGSSTKLQIRYDKNCSYIEKEEDSGSLITRIYPYDADNRCINETLIDDCEDETLYTASGAGTKEASTFKMNLTQGIKFNFAALNETFIRDLGAGSVIDLSNHTSYKFWVYSATDNAAGYTFGIGEAAYTEITVNTGALTAGCWTDITKDISAVANASKNAIRYIGIKNLTSGASSCVIDLVRAYDGDIYIDSSNASLYRVKKEYTFKHSAKIEKTSVTTKIYPSDDAYVRMENSTNYGTSTSMIVSNYTSTNHKTFLKFSLDAIPTGATITAATLNLYCWYVYGGGISNIWTKYCGSDWDELTITGSACPSSSGADLCAISATSVGWITGNVLTPVNAWFGGTSNYGVMLWTDTNADKYAHFNSKESGYKPYVEVTYTLTSSVEAIVKAAAEAYLYDHDEPQLKYSVKMTDLSQVIADTWEDETISLGDTARVYDSEIGINTDCRIKKITKDLINAANMSIELTNKTYTLADSEALKAQQLAYAMPFNDNPTIINANAIQKGYLGSEVG